MTTPDPSVTTDNGTAGFISHAHMRQYQERGLATPLSRLITDHVRYNEQWWIADRAGWHLITDDLLIQMLNTQSKWVDGNVYLGGRGE